MTKYAKLKFNKNLCHFLFGVSIFFRNTYSHLAKHSVPRNIVWETLS